MGSDDDKTVQNEKRYMSKLLTLAQVLEKTPTMEELECNIMKHVRENFRSGGGGIRFTDSNHFMDFMRDALRENSTLGIILSSPIEYAYQLVTHVFIPGDENEYEEENNQQFD